MRVFRSLVLFILLVVFFGAIFFFVSREFFLVLGINKIRSSLALLKQVEAREQFVGECSTRGSVRIEGEDFVRYQLRFENNKDYVLEAVCNGFSLSPILIESNSLPYLVEKNIGQSGILWGDYLSGIKLSVLGRTGIIYVEDRNINTRYSNSTDLSGSFLQPIASCLNYGFSCCQEDFEKGMGDALTIVTDCPKSCYSQCKPRPVVLSFTSQPFFDPKSRNLSINSGEEVTFFYVISDSQENPFAQEETDKKLSFFTSIYNFGQTLLDIKNAKEEKIKPKIVIDFGDGDQELLNDLQGSMPHVYFCSKNQGCKFDAVISASNSQNVESANNILSNIKVSVN